MSKVNIGTLPSTQNTFLVFLDSICAVTALIKNCDKSQIATVVSQFVTVAICDGSKHNFSDRFHSNRGYTPKCRKHDHINIGPFQEGFLGTSIMSFITDKHTHKHIYQWNNTKMGKIQLFIFMSKVNLGTLPITQSTLSVLLNSVCAVTALITICDKTQIATAGIHELSQIVTVVICDGSKHNFSDRFHSNRGYTPKYTKHVHIKIGPFQEGFLGTSTMGFITDIHTHKQIYQLNNTKMGKNTIFHIHIKSEPKYPEHVFSVVVLSLRRHGLDHKLRQITNCDGRDSWIVAICDCRNMWWFKTLLLR